MFSESENERFYEEMDQIRQKRGPLKPLTPEQVEIVRLEAELLLSESTYWDKLASGDFDLTEPGNETD